MAAPLVEPRKRMVTRVILYFVFSNHEQITLTMKRNFTSLTERNTYYEIRRSNMST